MVVVKVQICELCQPRQFYRNRPCQLILAKVQYFELCQPCQLHRYRSLQIVIIQIQSGHTPVVIGGHAVPFAQGPVAQPVLFVRPVRAIRRFVECDQYRPVVGRHLFAEVVGKDQKIAKSNCSITIQIKPRFISLITLTRPEHIYKQQEVRNTNCPVAIKVGGGIGVVVIVIRRDRRGCCAFVVCI